MSSETPGHRELDGGNVDALDELRRQARLLAERIEALSVAAPEFHGGDDDGGAAGVVPLPVAEDEELAAEAGIVLNSADQLVQQADTPVMPPVDEDAAVPTAAAAPKPPTPAAPPVNAAAAPAATEAGAATNVEEAHRGVRFADLPHPVQKRSRIRVVIWVLVVMALAAGAFYAGSWYAEQQRSENAAAATAEDSAAIAADEPPATADTAAADTTPGVVASEDGTADAEPVATEDASAAADSSGTADTTAEEPTAPAEPAEVLTAAETALVAAGYDSLVLGFEAGTLTIAGVVASSAVGTGYFNYVAGVTGAVADVAGVENVEPRLFLRGDDVALRSELALLVEEQPIEFDFASADLTEGSRTTLEQAAAVILANPGLRVLVAGHTDASGSAERNAELSAARAGAVITELVQLGVPVTRLTAVAYGELFPGTTNSDQENRRVVFEVAP